MRGVQWYQTCHMQTSCTHIEHTLHTSCTCIEHTLHTSCTHLAHILHIYIYITFQIDGASSRSIERHFWHLCKGRNLKIIFLDYGRRTWREPLLSEGECHQYQHDHHHHDHQPMIMIVINHYMVLRLSMLERSWLCIAMKVQLSTSTSCST